MQSFFSTHVRLFRHSFFVAANLVVLASFGSAGCESNVDVDGAGGEGACCLMDPQCPPSSEEVKSCFTESCFVVEACCTEKLCEPGGTCAAQPVCEAYELQVATCDGSTALSCRSVSDCGTTIFCEEPEFCTAVPSCDEGDIEQPTGVCPQDAGCYQVELCANVLLCQDEGLAHGCPDVPPLPFDTCNTPGVVCEYPIDGGDCYDAWTCVDETSASDEGFDDGAGAGGGSGAPQPSSTWQPLGTICVDGDGSGQ